MSTSPAVLGLSMSHISPRRVSAAVLPSAEPEPCAFRMDVAKGATLVQLRGPGSGPPTGGGMRGQVCGFSRASRKRLLDRLNAIPVDVLSDALFITLTLPDAALDRWGAERATRSEATRVLSESEPVSALGVAASKRALERFVKRLRRAWPKCSGIWRMERVCRRSGDYVGQLVPHYHVLVFNIPWMETRWLAEAWYESVGSGDERHLRAGTSVQRVRSRRGAMTYASKYMCKNEMAAPGEHTGRYWSVFGGAWFEVIINTFELTARQFYRLRRVLRAYVLKSWRGGGAVRGRWARAPGQGCTAYLSEASALRLLAWAAEPAI